MCLRVCVFMSPHPFLPSNLPRVPSIRPSSHSMTLQMVSQRKGWGVDTWTLGICWTLVSALLLDCIW